MCMNGNCRGLSFSFVCTNGNCRGLGFSFVWKNGNCHAKITLSVVVDLYTQEDVDGIIGLPCSVGEFDSLIIFHLKYLLKCVMQRELFFGEFQKHASWFEL